MRVPDFGRIELLGMEFLAYHGCLASEKEDGGRFVVDFRATVDLAAAEQSDSLIDTLDYSAVYKTVASEMASPSNLLENVAHRIREALEEAYPTIPEFEISVSKRNPPVGGYATVAKVTLKGGCAL